MLLLDEACEKYPTFDKLHMMKGQIFIQQRRIGEAREAFNKVCFVFT